ncbi:hypothetical protein ACLOAV_007418 [Pseudogymnoascus australis]
MDPLIDLPTASTCTTCTFKQDFSNYWTATLYFQSKNGTFIRVKQKGNQGFESANGGMTVYYSQAYDGSKVTAFKKGFRMVVGNPTYRTAAESSKNRQLTFICLQDLSTRTGETTSMPVKPCPADHTSHVAYPSSGTFESNGPCPASHPVKLPQLFYEVIWDTTPYNDRSLWPDDGSQPFVWSYGDPTGYGTHGDYVFGWEGTSLQQAMDRNCQPGPCAVLSEQSIAAGNACSKSRTVDEEIDGCKCTVLL